jgi:hypothetical protein
MYKKIIFIFLLLISTVCISQTVKIKGLALDTVKSRNSVMINVNDTLKKFRDKSSLTKKWDGYDELTKNKNFVVFTDSVGNFNISAKLTDSLYFYATSYLTQKYAVSDLLKRKEIKIQLEPEKCIPFVSCEQKKPSNYYIFIGKKLKLEGQKPPYYCNTIIMDGEFKSTYKIEKNLYGNFPKDTIIFTAFDHYGIPEFSNCENVLLFVGEYCGKLYHEKYQYFDLYKTKNGKWASPGNPYKNDNYAKEKNIVPKKINFENTIYFDISKLNAKQIEDEYPAEYYKIIEKKAIPTMGTYVEDLVEIKKNGVLKARKIELE